MKTKPNDIDIIDYLYGELSPAAHKDFEDYMREHTEFAEEVDQLKSTQKILPALPDAEVIPPLTKFNLTSGKTGFQSYNRWLYPLSIAASVVLVLLVGYLTNFNLSLKNGQFTVSFHQQSNQLISRLATEEVQRMIDQGIKEASNTWVDQMDMIKSDFVRQLENNEQLTEARIKQVAAQKINISDEQLNAFVLQLEDENVKAMKSFYQASAKDQQQYMRTILLEFNDYLESQRSEDLALIRTNLLQIQNSTVEKQQETDKILASIITTVNGQNSLGQ